MPAQCSLEAHATARAFPRQLSQSRVAMTPDTASRLLVVVPLSSERTPASARQDSSFAEPEPAAIDDHVVVGGGHRDCPAEMIGDAHAHADDCEVTGRGDVGARIVRAWLRRGPHRRRAARACLPAASAGGDTPATGSPIEKSGLTRMCQRSPPAATAAATGPCRSRDADSLHTQTLRTHLRTS
jgi:hypothetical protein